MECNTMKKILMIMLMWPMWSFGQVRLCGNCATTIVEPNNLGDCCENCLREFYIGQLNRNIIHGMLSPYYDHETWSSFIPFPDTLSAHFMVDGIETTNGYYLESSELYESTFYLISLKCEDSSAVHPGTRIVLVVNDSSSFKIGESYLLSLLPYFKKNQSFSVCNGKTYTMIGGAQTFFDLVYKKWLIGMLPVENNYFFLKP